MEPFLAQSWKWVKSFRSTESQASSTASAHQWQSKLVSAVLFIAAWSAW